ncbi:alanyl-tRNA editing protein, partial [Haloarculaceae archaeon H-GB1-1]|nr:alanyl-tRNA editing protein [Haloarculaceae archaeon H-GB1-1]
MATHAPAEPYVTSFEATVERVEDREVVLDATYFYPEGGGQPADRGTLGGVEVVDVQKGDGEVVHTLSESPDFEADDDVAGEVDETYRTYCMRAHTASHVLYGAGRRLLDDLGYGGFGITDEKVRVDFTTPTEIDDEVLVELERLVNRAVWESRPVSWENLPQEEALELDDIAFNTKTEEGVTGDETVRVVTVGEPASGEGDVWDVAACGGTHVENTREIGPVTVLDRSNPGEGMTRVEFAVGPAAIERRADAHRAAREAARTLDTRPLDLPEMVESVADERDELEAELDDLQEMAVDARIAELQEETFERDGQSWLVGDVPGLDANGLADTAQDIAGD